MKPGFYTIMAAQFFSSLADNALLIAAIALLRELHEPAWMTPALKQSFVVSYVVLAPLVGAFADSMPKGRVMLFTNAIKVLGCALMLIEAHPLAAYGVVVLGAAADRFRLRRQRLSGARARRCNSSSSIGRRARWDLRCRRHRCSRASSRSALRLASFSPRGSFHCAAPSGCCRSARRWALS